ncbi:zf-C2H2_6 domain-containing protein [Cephalotus follicularis]|uniref:Zf-C2H2_6 domain-containing protein n=1 Tax=Cephalotus follicularis TaxID=3775 RepID=A0A1Q3CDB3_CEPFO|nr:zf-C2H2_6 domain-containing protein [Cephalotus follicularis]
MEAQEEVLVMSKEHTNILKGKRTKRIRPQSPIPFAITANSSSGDGGGGGFDSDNNNKIIMTTMLSPTTSNEYNQDSTEEEEDMANCLILLAQGQSLDSLPPPKQSDNDMGNHKFNSRRFMETVNPIGGGKAGYYVYECKTCNRTFPSFQALGGHRASHKKPKAMVEERRNFVISSDEEEGNFKNISSLSLQLSTNKGVYNSSNNSNNKSKVHECSICGAEFTSGQALGGHMRRHRGPLGTNTTLSLTPMVIESDQEPVKKPRSVLSLDLDLNLPAPEDDHRESKFSFASTQQEERQQQQQQQSPLVFSAPALVDCHY